MTPYVENNTNPLITNDRYRYARDTRRPAVRAFYTRGRSRSNPRQRSTSRNSSTPRNNSYNRSRSISNNGVPRRECSICGERHLETTTGCPHLYRHVNLQDYVDNTSRRDVEQQVQEMRNSRRERSRSRGSSHSRTSRRSNSRE